MYCFKWKLVFTISMQLRKYQDVYIFSVWLIFGVVYELDLQNHFVSQSFPWPIPWWRHQMETISTLLAICAGNSPVPGEFPAQRPVTRSFDVFFDLRLNKRFSKQSWGWWFETLRRPLWRIVMLTSFIGAISIRACTFSGKISFTSCVTKHIHDKFIS